MTQMGTLTKRTSYHSLKIKGEINSLGLYLRKPTTESLYTGVSPPQKSSVLPQAASLYCYKVLLNFLKAVFQILQEAYVTGHYFGWYLAVSTNLNINQMRCYDGIALFSGFIIMVWERTTCPACLSDFQIQVQQQVIPSIRLVGAFSSPSSSFLLGWGRREGSLPRRSLFQC